MEKKCPFSVNWGKQSSIFHLFFLQVLVVVWHTKTYCSSGCMHCFSTFTCCNQHLFQICNYLSQPGCPMGKTPVPGGLGKSLSAECGEVLPNADRFVAHLCETTACSELGELCFSGDMTKRFILILSPEKGV